MEQKISNRKVSEIKIEEVKMIVSSMFKKDWQFDVNFPGLNASWTLHSSRFNQGIKNLNEIRYFKI